MKKISLIIVSLIIIIFLVIGVTNKTYFKKYYEATNPSGNKIKIPLPIFSYFKELNGEYNVTFNTLRRTNKIRYILGKYVENLQSCYDESYFYDKALDITISKYQVENEFPFNKIELSYTYGDYCKNEYVLDDNWMNDVIEHATINEVMIYRCTLENSSLNCKTKDIKNTNVEEVLNNISIEDLERVENYKNISFDETKDYYLINVYYTLNKKGYVLYVFKYYDDIAFKVIDDDDHQKNAIYKIDKDVNKLLSIIYNKY